jgi:hypothetical protein
LLSGGLALLSLLSFISSLSSFWFPQPVMSCLLSTWQELASFVTSCSSSLQSH